MEKSEKNKETSEVTGDKLDNYKKLSLTGTIEIIRPDLVKQAKAIKTEEDLQRLLKGEYIYIKGGKFYLFVKRGFDLFNSILAILLLSWLFLILSVAVKISSKGPIIYKDKRVGLNGKKINVYKFRTMYWDAEKNIDEYLTPEMKSTWVTERKIEDDPRITKLGKFLRKSSLDELPQLFNIFIGNLSFVGPRPIKNYELLSAYTPYQVERLLSVKPGLTGYWQVYGRSKADYESGKRQKEELAYLPKRSVLFDLKLLLMTVPSVISDYIRNNTD